MNSIIICVIYAVAKLFKIEVRFMQLLTAFENRYPESLQRTRNNISLYVEGMDVEMERSTGNIIDFYNGVFVSVNNEFLIQMKKNIP